MWLRVLGSAAGGGFPQWNCTCPTCTALRTGTRPCRSRTQSSVAVSADFSDWFLINTSPDLHAQIESFEPLHPRSDRTSPVRAVLLTDAELDHTLGLLLLRESSAIELHATAAVRDTLRDGSALLATLERYCEVSWKPVVPGVDVQLGGGLSYNAFDVPTTKTQRFASADEGRVVGYRLTDESSDDGPVVYLPCAADLGNELLEQLDGTACALIDGTCWRDDELPALGLAGKTSRAMGHLPISGPGGSLERLSGVSIDRKIYIHMNNTNPILLEDSAERHAVEERGFEVSADGLEVKV